MYDIDPRRETFKHVKDWVRAQPLHATPKYVLHALADRYGSNGEVFPSQQLLARDTGLTDRGVRNALDYLESEGYISRDRGSRRASTRYHLHVELGVIAPLCAYGARRVRNHVPVPSAEPGSGLESRVRNDVPVSAEPRSYEPSVTLSDESSTDSYVHTEDQKEEELGGRDGFAVVLDEGPGGPPDGASASPRSTSGRWCGVDAGTWWLIEDLADRRDVFMHATAALSRSLGDSGPAITMALLRGAWTKPELPTLQDLDRIIATLEEALAGELRQGAGR